MSHGIRLEVAEQLQFTVDQRIIRMYAQEQPPTGKRAAAVVLLHGAGGNLDFWAARFGPVLQQAGYALYAPHYFDRTGTTRADLSTITDGVHVGQWLETIEAALAFAGDRPGVDPQRIVLVGISLGAFLSLACAAKLSAADAQRDRMPIRAIVEISGGLVEPYLSLAGPSFPPTLILHGAQDTVVPASHAANLDQKLTALNVAHRTEILPGEGHWFTTAALPRMLLATSSFLQEHLQSPEVRRQAL